MPSEKEWSIDLLMPAVQANGLSDGEDMTFIERLPQGRPAIVGFEVSPVTESSVI